MLQPMTRPRTPRAFFLLRRHLTHSLRPFTWTQESRSVQCSKLLRRTLLRTLNALLKRAISLLCTRKWSKWTVLFPCQQIKLNGMRTTSHSSQPLDVSATCQLKKWKMISTKSPLSNYIDFGGRLAAFSRQNADFRLKRSLKTRY